jgi:WhiB family transcriptional regulator, redox-sensing transcriptional regulator
MTTLTGLTDWRAAAACLRADPDLFFPISAKGKGLSQISRAKAICANCPVRRECLKFAKANEPVHGIWGGMTQEEREREGRRERRAVRRRAGHAFD